MPPVQARATETDMEKGGLLVNRTHMPFVLDGGVAARARIGLIILATDHTLEYEFRKIFTMPGVPRPPLPPAPEVPLGPP